MDCFWRTARKIGTVLFAPLRIRLWKKTFREPDIMFMLARHAKQRGEDFWEGADLVIEVVSASAKDRYRDLVMKRREYAQAGIPEYWIVDRKLNRITVLKLRGKQYVIYSEAESGEMAKSALLSGFEVDVEAVMASTGA